MEQVSEFEIAAMWVIGGVMHLFCLGLYMAITGNAPKKRGDGGGPPKKKGPTPPPPSDDPMYVPVEWADRGSHLKV